MRLTAKASNPTPQQANDTQGGISLLPSGTLHRATLNRGFKKRVVLLFLLVPTVFIGFVLYYITHKLSEATTLGKMTTVDREIVAEYKVNATDSPGDNEKKDTDEKTLQPQVNAQEPPSTIVEEEVPTLVTMENVITSIPAEKMELQPTNSPSHVSLAKKHFNHALKLERGGEVRQAIEEYLKVIELDPRHYKAYNNLGVLYSKCREFNSAVENYRRALALEPGYVKAYNNLGISLMQLSRHEEAVEAFTRAIALNEHNVESYNNLGILYKHIGEKEKAKKTFEEGLAHAPDNAEVHYNLALLYESEKNLEQAFNHYLRFLELASPEYQTLKERVRMHLFTLAKGSTLEKENPDRQALNTTVPQHADTHGNYLLQVASFIDRQKALALSEELKAQGYHSFIDDVVFEDGTTRHRVQIGYFSDRDQAEHVRSQLKQRFNLEPLVLSN